MSIPDQTKTPPEQPAVDTPLDYHWFCQYHTQELQPGAPVRTFTMTQLKELAQREQGITIIEEPDAENPHVTYEISRTTRNTGIVSPDGHIRLIESYTCGLHTNYGYSPDGRLTTKMYRAEVDGLDVYDVAIYDYHEDGNYLTTRRYDNRYR